MAEAAEKIPKTSIAGFDAFVAGAADEREFELIDGVIVAMSNPTETHEQIAANIGAPLKLAMDRRGCRTYQGGMRVQASEDIGAYDKYRPDLLVRCGPSENKTFVTDPIVIVEVLSPSTTDHDRGRKPQFYKDIVTTKHIVLAYSDQMRVEHYVRADEGWRLNVLTAPRQVLELDAVDFRIELSQAYFDISF